MKARVFFDAFAECLVYVALARKHPQIRSRLRQTAINAVVHIHRHEDAGDATGCMFDTLWNEAQRPGAKR